MGYGYAQKEHMLKCVSASSTTIKDLQADSGVDTNKGFLNNQNKQSRSDLKDTQSAVPWPPRTAPSHFLWPVSTIFLLCQSPVRHCDLFLLTWPSSSFPLK